mgnify:CR=1 FL=1
MFKRLKEALAALRPKPPEKLVAKLVPKVEIKLRIYRAESQRWEELRQRRK